MAIMEGGDAMCRDDVLMGIVKWGIMAVISGVDDTQSLTQLFSSWVSIKEICKQIVIICSQFMRNYLGCLGWALIIDLG